MGEVIKLITVVFPPFSVSLVRVLVVVDAVLIVWSKKKVSRKES